MMRRVCIWGLWISLFLSVFACSKGEQQEGETLVKINDFDLSLREFQLRLAEELKYDERLKLTNQVKEDFLNQLIQEELLIQEAKRLRLDRKEKFVRAMERYWKSTLIRDLLESKAREIGPTTLVSQAEIEAHYERVKQEGNLVGGVDETYNRMAEEVREKKKRQKLEEWMAELHQKADIQINQKLLLRDGNGG